MIYIGIDFGHGETTVSRVPGYNGAQVSQISLKNTNNVAEKKIVSAVCKKEGHWSLVYGVEDFICEDLREGFKAMISSHNDNVRQMSNRDKESMIAFSNLVFKAILRNDTDLEYNSPDDKNFKLGIACPSGWFQYNPNAQQEYLDFFRNECNLPVDLCIKESDAAFFSKFANYSGEDCVFVIDLGSSTIDFTAYAGETCIRDCCWGENLGAHLIDDALVSSISQSENNFHNIQQVNNFRREIGWNGDCYSAISLITRENKERYYARENANSFSMAIPFSELAPNWPGGDWDNCIRYRVSKDEFDNIVENYKNRIHETIRNAKDKLKQNGVIPNRILLSGGACRMPFIQQYAVDIFGVKVDIDTQPECVVSNGIALYAEALDKTTEGPIGSLNSKDFSALYKKADQNATLEAAKELFPTVLNTIEGSQDMSGNEMFKEIAYFFLSLNPENEEYVRLLNQSVSKDINEEAFLYINEALQRVFNKSIEKDDVNIVVDAQAMYYPLEFFTEGPGGQKIHDILVEATGPHIFTSYDPERNRSISERSKVGKLCRERLCVRDPFGIGYDEDGLRSIANSIKEQCISETMRIINSKQLFETTFKQ